MSDSNTPSPAVTLTARDRRRLARIAQAAQAVLDESRLAVLRLSDLRATLPRVDLPTMGRALRLAGWTPVRARGAGDKVQTCRWHPPGHPITRRPPGRPLGSKNLPRIP